MVNVVAKLPTFKGLIRPYSNDYWISDYWKVGVQFDLWAKRLRGLNPD